MTKLSHENIYVTNTQKLGYEFKFTEINNTENPKIILEMLGKRKFAYTRNNAPLHQLKEHLLKEVLEELNLLQTVDREIHDKRLFSIKHKGGEDEFLLFKQSKKLPKSDKSYRASRRFYKIQNT